VGPPPRKPDYKKIYIIYDIFVKTVIGLPPGGSKYSTHLHSNNTQNDTKNKIYTGHFIMFSVITKTFITRKTKDLP